MVDWVGLPVARKGLVAAILGREVVRTVARDLSAAQIPIMPLKGVLLQQLVYARDPSRRSISDVDLLVPAAQFEPALEILLSKGYQPLFASRSLIEVALRSPLGLTVDLHRRLFSPFRYRLREVEVFHRARLDKELFGVQVTVAHPLDTLAHLVGKWVSDQGHFEAASRAEDLGLLVKFYDLNAPRAAAHLEAMGMARAARFVFSELQTLAPFFTRGLAALEPDPVGSACVRAAGQFLRQGRRGMPSIASAHLLNSSLPQGIRSLVAVASKRGKFEWARRSAKATPRTMRPFFSRNRLRRK